ncbi:MAG: prepilin-type N-terminal cleavage/methylation domain-containing protein [Thermodesulfobacteriota bacterium]
MMVDSQKTRPGFRNGASPANQAKKAPAGASTGGFTIIEVMLALVIFSVGLLGVASMQTSSVTGNTSSKLNTMAVEYASDYMENLLALGVDKDIDDIFDTYEQLDPADADDPHEPDDFVGDDFDGDDADDLPYYPELDSLFDLTWTVADDTSGSGLAAEGPVKVISVTVRWANGNRAITLSSIKGEAL